MSKSKFEYPLVNFLIELERKQDRAAMAALRTGLGKPPGSAPLMFPYVSRFLKEDYGARVSAAFLVAALFGLHPNHQDVGSLGASLRLASARHGESGLERRLVAALDAHPDDLPHHVEGLLRMCESSGVPVDYHLLLAHLGSLLNAHSDHELRRNEIRRRWAREFWAAEPESQEPAADPNPSSAA